MKKRTIRYLNRARKDIAAILLWISERSPQGAARLVLAMETALERAKRFPFAYSIAPESRKAGVEVRQIFFKTPRGRKYRLIVRVDDEALWVLRVRGPGQRPLEADELE